MAVSDLPDFPGTCWSRRNAVTGGDHTGVPAIHSLSKRSNLAGYRAAFAAGDPALVGKVLEVRNTPA